MYTCILHRLRYLNLDNNEIYIIPHLKLLGTSPLKPGKSTGEPSSTTDDVVDDGGDSVGTPTHVHSHSTLLASQDDDRNKDGHNEQMERNESSDGGHAQEERVKNDSDNKIEEDKDVSIQEKSVGDGGEIEGASVGQQQEKVEGSQSLGSENRTPLGQTTENVAANENSVSEQIREEEEKEGEGEGVVGGESSEQRQRNQLHSEVSTGVVDTTAPLPLHLAANLPTQHDESSLSTTGTVVPPPLHPAVNQTVQSSSAIDTLSPLHSAVNQSSSVAATLTPPHSVTVPRPIRTEPSTPTTPSFDTVEKEKVGHKGSLQSVSGEDEKLKELAPFPQLETLSLINNMVGANGRSSDGSCYLALVNDAENY